jgi:integrase
LCKTPEGWKRFAVILSKNGRVKTGWISEGGREVQYPEGRFQVRTFEGSKRVWKNAGLDATDALAMRDRVARRLEIIVQAGAAGVEVKEEKGRVAIRPAVTRYLQHCRQVEAEVAAGVYGRTLADFMRSLPDIQYVDQINAEVMVRFGVALRAMGNEARTVFNKHRNVLGFMRWLDVDVKALKIRTPKFEKKIAVVYSDAQIASLMAAADRYFKVVIDLLRMTGLREQEGVHLEWRNIDFENKIVQVRSKPEWNFKIKDREERDVPMPGPLAAVLRSWFLEHGGDSLVLGTKEGKPHQKWLRLLKRAGRLAGLNCGRCDGCREQNECELYTLHSFRRTYATTLHRKGVDVRTLMGLLGHADIETTLKYLAPMKAEESHVKVNEAFA